MKALHFLVFTAVCFALLTGCGTPQAGGNTASDVQMTVQAEPEPLAVGATTLIVTLKDAQGVPVDGANVKVHGDMDHAGMMPIDRESEPGVAGVYRVAFEWTMGGDWIMKITARLPDGREIEQTARYTVEAVSSDSIIRRTTPTAPASSGKVNIAYGPESNPISVGDSPVMITLTTGEGTPIDDAQVQVVGNMAHAGMMPIEGRGEPTGNGRYRVPLRWTMAGDWIVTVEVTLADGSRHSQPFDQAVVMP